MGPQVLALTGPGMTADLREVRGLGATLVMLRSQGGPTMTRVFTPSTPSGSMDFSAGVAAAATPSDRGASARDAYYVRLLLGSAFDLLPPQRHGWIGRGPELVPLREMEVWGRDGQPEILQQALDSRSLLVADGARVLSTEASSGSSLMLGVGGRLYEVSLRAKPFGADGWHRIDIGLTRRGLPRWRASGGEAVEASLLVENGRVVIVGVSDPLLAGDPGSPSPDTVLLAVSPRFGDLARQDDAGPPLDEPVDVPPILVESTAAEYPREARRRDVEGQVVLRAAVRRDGSVDGVQILSLPDMPGAEYLIEAAAGAVRRWRYLPALRDGETVPTYVTVTLEFGGS